MEEKRVDRRLNIVKNWGMRQPGQHFMEDPQEHSIGGVLDP